MEEIRSILVAAVAWIMLVVTAPILGAVLGRYLGLALLSYRLGSSSYRGALGALGGYLVGAGLALVALFQVIAHTVEILGILFPHLK